MKTKLLYLTIIVTLLLAACSSGTVTTNSTNQVPAAQAASASAAPVKPQGVQAQPPAPGGAAQNAQTNKVASSQPITGTNGGAGQDQPGRTPPAEAIAACSGKSAQATCDFTSNKGAETGVCELVQNQLTCSPQHGPANGAQPGNNGSQAGGAQSNQAGNQSGAATSNQSGKQQGNSAKGTAPSQPITGTNGSAAQGQAAGGGTPPTEAIAACDGKSAQATCNFTSNKGTESGVCEMVQNQLACSPQRGPATGTPSNQPGAGQPAQDGQQGGGQPVDANGSAYNIEQAISDKAQGMTISYDALAFLTGDLGADSFFPPGKVADFWGFQYLRDNDPSEMGHAGDFLTSAAMNMLNTLTADQRAQLVALAKSQVSQINEYGYKRFVLIDAFQRLLDGKLPTGTTGLSEDAVKAYSAELYHLDGEISYARAELMGKLINSMSADQKAALEALKGKGMKEWPTAEEPADIKGLDRDVKVAVMTYAADMLSWYVGSVDADVYFCPERHGTYFGSFYLKDIKAMSDPTYAIPTNMTGDMGEAMLQKLNTNQAQLITGLVDVQKPSLQGVVDTRRAVSTELRKFLAGGTADKATVLSLMDKYGAYDGEIIYNLATHFTEVGQSLSADQKAQITAMRTELLGAQSHPTGAYLYSQAVPMPEIPSTDFLFK